jgi:hypothetical protein
VALALSLELGLFRYGTDLRARQQSIAGVLQDLTPVVPADARCIAFDPHSVDVFATTSYRYIVDGWRFSQPRQPACRTFLLSKLRPEQVLARIPGARIVASEQHGSTNRLWIRPGAVQNALAQAGRLPAP